MAEQGFEYQPDPGADEPGVFMTVAEVYAQRYVAPSVVNGITGYGFDAIDEAYAEEAASLPDPFQTGGYAKALHGTSDLSTEIEGIEGGAVGELRVGDGCLGEALVDIFGTLDGYAEYVQAESKVNEIGGIAWSRLMTEPAADIAAEEWSNCMSQHGYDYDIPMDVANRDWPGPRPQPGEQAVAVADHECRVETSVDLKLAELDGAYQAELLETHSEALQTVIQYYDMLETLDPAEDR